MTVKSPSADDHGHVAFVLTGSDTSTAVKLHSDGETMWSSDYPATAIALDSEGEMAVGINGASTMTLSKLDVWGTPLWTRAFPTEGVDLKGVVFDSQGNVGFWGSINGRSSLARLLSSRGPRRTVPSVCSACWARTAAPGSSARPACNQSGA